MITVTAEQVISTLREVANERPDYVYALPEHMNTGYGPSCRYVHTDENGENPEAGCIVGAVLARLGTPLNELISADAMGTARTVVPAFLNIIGDAPQTAANMLADAQAAQDGSRWDSAGIRKTWADSLAYAESNADLPRLLVAA